MPRSAARVWLLVMAFGVIWGGGLRAQTATGEITGLVRDQGGSAVPGAAITATEMRTSVRRVVVSTGDGLYTAASLPPGEYRLDLELAGFKSVRRTGIRISTGEKARIDFDLEVGALQEQCCWQVMCPLPFDK